MTKTRKKAKLGRPFAPKGKVATERAICWLIPADKERLQTHAKEQGVSESAMLRDGLVAIGALESDTSDDNAL